MATKKVVAKKVVKRRSGYLYYIDGNGNAIEVKAKVGGTKGAKRKPCKHPVKKAAKKKVAAKKATVRKPQKRTAKKTLTALSSTTPLYEGYKYKILNLDGFKGNNIQLRTGQVVTATGRKYGEARFKGYTYEVKTSDGNRRVVHPFNVGFLSAPKKKGPAKKAKRR